MNFSEYQAAAKKTAIYPDQFALIYPALGLAGEAGEVADKLKKIIRDDDCQMTPEKLAGLRKEIGDVLWYLAAIANDLGEDLGQIAEENIEKLNSRAARGVLGGSGDNR